MKNYQEFLNEVMRVSDDNFIFAIDLRNTAKDDINKIFKLAIEYFDDFLEFNGDCVDDIEKHKPWAVIFNMYTNLTIDGKKISVALNNVTTPNWGEGIKHMDDIVTAKEFLEVGFANIEKYIIIKKSQSKFNL